MPIEVRPITGALGAEIHGVDLGADLDDASVATVRRALLDHCVVFFRDQRFDATQHKALASRFGEIFEVRSVELGRSDGKWIEVVNGLAPGTSYAATNSFVLKADLGKAGASHEH